MNSNLRNINEALALIVYTDKVSVKTLISFVIDLVETMDTASTVQQNILETVIIQLSNHLNVSQCRDTVMESVLENSSLAFLLYNYNRNQFINASLHWLMDQLSIPFVIRSVINCANTPLTNSLIKMTEILASMDKNYFMNAAEFSLKRVASLAFVDRRLVLVLIDFFTSKKATLETFDLILDEFNAVSKVEKHKLLDQMGLLQKKCSIFSLEDSLNFISQLETASFQFSIRVASSSAYEAMKWAIALQHMAPIPLQMDEFIDGIAKCDSDLYGPLSELALLCVCLVDGTTAARIMPKLLKIDIPFNEITLNAMQNVFCIHRNLGDTLDCPVSQDNMYLIARSTKQIDKFIRKCTEAPLFLIEKRVKIAAFDEAILIKNLVSVIQSDTRIQYFNSISDKLQVFMIECILDKLYNNPDTMDYDELASFALKFIEINPLISHDWFFSTVNTTKVIPIEILDGCLNDNFRNYNQSELTVLVEQFKSHQILWNLLEIWVKCSFKLILVDYPLVKGLFLSLLYDVTCFWNRFRQDWYYKDAFNHCFRITSLVVNSNLELPHIDFSRESIGCICVCMWKILVSNYSLDQFERVLVEMQFIEDFA